MLVKIISTILKNTYTTDELSQRLNLMRKYYSEYLFAGAENLTLKDVLEGKCDGDTLRALGEWIGKFEESGIQPIVIYEAIDSIQEDLTGIPSITLYVPVRFSTEQIKKIGTWFRENVQPNMLMSVHIDPRSTGGCSFVWNNIYYDFSLKYFLDKKKEEIVSAFNKHERYVN
jgi:hypothetical protein